jgi:arylsulfatase
LDQPNGWFGETVALGWPEITNLRLDPLERTGVPRSSNSGSLFATDWYAHEFWRFVFSQQAAEDLAETFIEYPPMQGSASFNLEGIKKQIQNAQLGK